MSTTKNNSRSGYRKIEVNSAKLYSQDNRERLKMKLRWHHSVV
ncbi:hypothetical protein [Enterobacter kobei]|nr:hypothetical protein [Enterobacter kobei]UXJ66652.1 hypothetical protein N5P26_21895 [Enterobacter kobei]